MENELNIKIKDIAFTLFIKKDQVYLSKNGAKQRLDKKSILNVSGHELVIEHQSNTSISEAPKDRQKELKTNLISDQGDPLHFLLNSVDIT